METKLWERVKAFFRKAPWAQIVGAEVAVALLLIFGVSGKVSFVDWLKAIVATFLITYVIVWTIKKGK